MTRVWRIVPRPVLGSRMALFGLALRPLLFTIRALGGVSVGVPRFRGRALRTFWETESGWVFNPVHLTATVIGEKKIKSKFSCTHSCSSRKFSAIHLKVTKATVLRNVLSCSYLLQSSSALQTQDWCFHFHGQSPVGKRSPLGHYTHCNKVFYKTGFKQTSQNLRDKQPSILK